MPSKTVAACMSSTTVTVCVSTWKYECLQTCIAVKFLGLV